MGNINMKAIFFVPLITAIMTQALWAQQFTPPAAPPGAKGKGDVVEAEILKVYSMEDQGATFRAYVVKYKGNEVTVSDTLAATTKKVGDKITIIAVRVEVPLGDRKIHSLSFQIMNTALPKKK
jgi:hypothetical protein